MTRRQDIAGALDYFARWDGVAMGSEWPELRANVAVLTDELRQLPAGQTIGGMRAVIESQRSDLDHLKGEIESLRREVAAQRGERCDAAPKYPGHVWSTKHTWSGPFHLVPVTTHPYPGNPDLPDVWAPAAKALCGAPYAGVASQWPKAAEVCVGCAARGERATGVSL